MIHSKCVLVKIRSQPRYVQTQPAVLQASLSWAVLYQLTTFKAVRSLHTMDLHDSRGRPLTPGPISCPNSTCTGCLSSGMRATCPSHLTRLNLTSPAIDGSLQECLMRSQSHLTGGPAKRETSGSSSETPQGAECDCLRQARSHTHIAE